MITLLGDIHGIWYDLRKAISIVQEENSAAIIQVGDFGLMGDDHNNEVVRQICRESDIPVYFIDGNHDNCSHWAQFTKVTRIWDDSNLHYIPRGHVMEIDGRTVAFMGGAGSIDKAIRLERRDHWDAREDINTDDVIRLWRNTAGVQLDHFIVHCPPQSIIDKHFDPFYKLHFRVPVDWIDPNCVTIEHLWENLGKPYMYAGHMHRRVAGEDFRILDIGEVINI